jgi:hypothetical protein
MRLVYGDFWAQPADHRVITTNGDVRKDGACVMGRGVALQAAQRFPSIPYELGAVLKVQGNHVHQLGYGLWSFPVKHHWRDQADLDLIEQSARELEPFARATPAQTWLLVRPGVGNGRRDWAEVEPLIACLPDNVLVITYA